ncbi:MAG TPA: hypothetical protein GXX75_19655 [Clostridiales bacterium]|nr:hypothetical protein [Clostridiales bacterium]
MQNGANLQEKILFREKLGMLLGGMGGVPLFAIITAFLVYFYTNVMGIDAGAIGVIILVSKIFDGISDIVFGNMIDKTRSKLGVCRPWVFRIAIFVAVAIISLFTVPRIGNVGQLVYVFISYNISQTIIYTILLVTLTSLPTYMTRDSVQRSSLFVWSFIGQGVMTAIVSSVTLQIVNSIGGDQRAWILAGIVYAAIGVVCILSTGFLCKERVNPDELTKEGQKVPFIKVLKSILVNKYWMQVLLIVVFGAGVFAASSMMATYYSQYVLGDVNLAGMLNAAYTVPLIVIGFLLMPLVQRFQKRTIILTGVLIQLFGCILAIIFPAVFPVLLAATVMKSVGQGCGATMYLPMLSDAIEYGHWKTGIRSQAALMGANGAGQKVGQGLISAVLGGIMSFAGFSGVAATQSTSALSSISALFLYIPLAFTLLELLVIGIYDLDKRYPQIMEELLKREAAATEEE